MYEIGYDAENGLTLFNLSDRSQMHCKAFCARYSSIYGLADIELTDYAMLVVYAHIKSRIHTAIPLREVNYCVSTCC